MKMNRRPPHDIDAEASVLGACIFDRQAIDAAAVILEPADFFLDRHRAVYRAILDMTADGTEVSEISIGDRLRSADTLDAVGGLAWISSLADNLPTTSQVSHHAAIVKKHSRTRRFLEASEKQRALALDGDIDGAVEAASIAIEAVHERRLGMDDPAILMQSVLARLQEARERKDKRLPPGVMTSFHDLDRVLHGLRPTQLVLVAGRPGMGKTALAVNIAANAALRQQLNVAVFSLEMSAEELGLRLVCSEARVDSRKGLAGDLVMEDWRSVTSACHNISGSRIRIFDDPDTTVQKILAVCQMTGAQLGVVDYLQLMRHPGKHENRQVEVANMSRALKLGAKRLGIPLIVLCQLNRAIESRKVKRPMLSDLRESGALEQDADVVITVHRPSVYEQGNQREETDIAEVSIVKNRSGPTGECQLLFRKAWTRFLDMDQGHEEGQQLPLDSRWQKGTGDE